MARHPAVGYSGAANSALAGIVCAVAASFLFVLQDAGVKWLTAELVVLQILFLRSAVGLGYCAAALAVKSNRAALRVRQKKLMVARSVINVGAWLMFFTGLQYVDLGTALALFFTFPIFMTALSVPLLGEPVGPRRWAAVLVGFIGAMIMLDPRGGIDWPYILMISAAGCWSVVAIMTRKLAATEQPFGILFYTLASFVVMSIVPQFWVWQAPEPETWGLIVLIALFGVSAQFLIITAYAKASPATVAPFEYSALIWAALIGYLLWGDIPSETAAIGAIIIAASGLYIVHREARYKSAPIPRGDKGGA